MTPPRRYFIDGLAPDLRATLADPIQSLIGFGFVGDQETETVVPYDPNRITSRLQQTVLSYASDPPRTEDGAICWLSLLGGRQNGKSVSGEFAFYPKAAYNHNWIHSCIADVKWRADALHERTQLLHAHWRSDLRPPVQHGEKRQISFEHGSTMTVASAETDAGVGMSFSSLHASEVGYWQDAGRQFSLMNPAMINRKNAFMLTECTPVPMSEPSASWWKDRYKAAKMRKGRNIAAFFPFWDSKLCRRPWTFGQPDIEELRLLEAYGVEGHPERVGDHRYGITLENLAFRRLMFETDDEIRKFPELFGVYYPFDDKTCWITSGKQAIPHRVLERHARFPDLVPWGPTDSYIEYLEPKKDAVYVVGCDPAGWAGRDHYAFVILEVWHEEWRLAASFGMVCDPDAATDFMLEKAARYNNAMFGVERNKGDAPIALARKAGYRNIFYDRSGQPGVWKSNEDEMIAILVNALIEKFHAGCITDEDLVEQLLGYQEDRRVQRTMKAEILNPRKKDGRRDRHHWDKVSALMIACVLAENAPRRYLPVAKPENVIPINAMTWAQSLEYEKRLAQMRNPRQNSGRTRYKRVKRR